MEKTMMLGKTEGSRKRGRTSRCIDCIKEAIGRRLQELSRAAEDRTLWTSLIQSRQESEPTQGQVTNHIRPSIFSVRVLSCLKESPETGTTLYQLWQKSTGGKSALIAALTANYQKCR